MSGGTEDELRYLDSLREAQLAFERGISRGRMEHGDDEPLPMVIEVSFRAMITPGSFAAHVNRFEDAGRAVGRAQSSGSEIELRAPMFEAGTREDEDKPQLWALVRRDGS